MTWIARSVLYAGRGLGAFQVLTGLALWTRVVHVPVPVHVLAGLLVTLTLVLAATLGARSGASAWRVGVAFAWAGVLPVFGLTHGMLLVGPFHWLVEAVHVAVGLAGLAQVDALARGASRGDGAPSRRGRVA